MLIDKSYGWGEYTNKIVKCFTTLITVKNLQRILPFYVKKMAG